MKQAFLFITIIFFSVSALVAQKPSYKLLKVDFALGAAIPTGKGSKGGFLFAFEPKFNVQRHISVGLKAEFAGMARAALTPSKDVFRGDIVFNTVLQPTVEYLFGFKTGIRPFVGAGVGYYDLAEAANINVDDVSAGVDKDDFQRKQLVGVMLRAGIETWHLRLAAEFTSLPKTGTVVNNYWGIKLGFFIGGGKRKN